MTKILKADYENERLYTRAALVNVRDFVNLKTLTGESLLGRFPGAIIQISSDCHPSDYFTAGPLQIISDKLKLILEKASVRAELFPVEVNYQGVPYREMNFFFLNILDSADCLNRKESRYSEKMGYVGDISKLVINEQETQGKNLFRLANAYQVVILLSDSLASKIKDAGVVGAKFIEPSVWKGN